MSQIFIANPTLHNRQLQIRVSPKDVRHVSIAAGGQALFPDNLEGDALTKVIAELERAGGVPANDVGAIRSRFALLYTITDSKKAAIPSEAIDEGLEQDQEVRQELAAEVLEKSTVAAFRTGSDVGAQEVTMEITEVNDVGPVKGGVDAEFTAGTKRNVGRSGRSESRKR